MHSCSLYIQQTFVLITHFTTVGTVTFYSFLLTLKMVIREEKKYVKTDAKIYYIYCHC
jgi:hypothetical protein